MNSIQVSIDFNKAQELVDLLLPANVPSEQESSGHSFSWNGTLDDLGNAYLAIVGICHQTSPIGENKLQGKINGENKFGWDYLKEKFLLAANENILLTTSDYWQVITPYQLAELYQDEYYGKTLNRINERTLLLNNLGQHLRSNNLHYIREAFINAGQRITGDNGFLNLLSQTQAYSDPLHKKSLFFLSLAISECGWSPYDIENLLSPIDYHELRGHLRIGTLVILDNNLSNKVRMNLPVTNDDDLSLRQAAQKVNNWISEKTGFTNSALHYLLWNVFRSCCSRNLNETHCLECGQSCQLPARYKQMNNYSNHCIFADICQSANQPLKVSDPPYTGHYY
jgi:hypothetical protein